MTNPKTVLIADSDPKWAASLAERLRQDHGYHALVFHTMGELREALEQKADSIFVVIVELQLNSSVSGASVDLCLEYGLPTIVLTGPLENFVLEDLQEKNIADYAFKQDEDSIPHLVRIVHRIRRNANTKVLVVDASSTAKELMSRLLKLQQFHVLEASTREQAEIVLDENADIRIVIIDCFYGESDGFDLTRFIRQKYKESELVIIGVSKHGGQDLSAKFIKYGANDFLLKPFLREEFFCRVNHAAEFLDQVHGLIELNEQKNRLLGMAAHDVRGPIGGNIGLIDLLLDHDLSDNEATIFLETIQKTNYQMLDLLNGLLDISSIHSGKVDLKFLAFDFCALISERVSFFQLAANKKNLSLSCTIPDKKLVEIDPVRMTQVIDNLISNAIKFTPQGRQISVTLDVSVHDVQLNVIDQGLGIKEVERCRLFGAFEKLSTLPTGGETSTGLGLAICKSIVEAHKGVIGYNVAAGGGSHFYVQVPLVSETI